MSETTRLPGPPEDFERRLLETARAFAYPPTPDIAAAVTRGASTPQKSAAHRRLALAVLALAAILLAVVLAVPPVRAAVLDWIRIGAVRIFLVQPSPTPAATTLPGTPAPTVLPSPTPLPSVLDLFGETSLADARKRAGFPVLLPTFPTDLGPTDHVYLQQFDVPSIVLVWMEKAPAKGVRLVLSETPSKSEFYQKMVPREVANTRVSGQPAYWVTAPYLLVAGNGNMTVTRLIEKGHTLIWTAGETTFRLETLLDQADAVRIAESLR